METFLPVPGYPNYQVSNLGQVMANGVIKKLGWSKSGYLVTKFCNPFGYKTMKIHRIVAKVFLGDYSLYNLEVNHKDGNKKNCTADNLEWVTKKENMEHAKRLGLLKRKFTYKTTAQEKSEKTSGSPKVSLTA